MHPNKFIYIKYSINKLTVVIIYTILKDNLIKDYLLLFASSAIFALILFQSISTSFEY